MILCQLIFYRPAVLRWIFDKYLSTFLLFFLLLPDNKHSPTERYLSEIYVADAVGSTSSLLEGILNTKPSCTKIMVIIEPHDEKSLGPYNIIRFDVVVLYFSASTNISIIFHTYLKKYRWQKITAFGKQWINQKHQRPKEDWIRMEKAQNYNDREKMK